jgi:putative RecB family exonuclease
MTAARLLTCSPSSLTAFGNCPRAYWYGHVARPRPAKPPQHAYRAVGIAAHSAMAALWDPDAPSTDEAVRRVWPHQAFGDEARSARWLAIVQGWVVNQWFDVGSGRQPPAVERTVSLRTGVMALSGRVDVVREVADPDAGTVLTVDDFKAGHKPPAEGACRTSLAMPLYVIAAGRTLRRAVWRAALRHLPTGRVDSAVFDRDSLGRHLGRADELATDIAAARDTAEAGASVDEVFPVRPGPLCRHCDWREHCPAGADWPAADPEGLLDRWEQQIKTGETA